MTRYEKLMSEMSLKKLALMATGCHACPAYLDGFCVIETKDVHCAEMFMVWGNDEVTGEEAANDKA